MTRTREAAYAALFELGKRLYSWKNTPSRRLVLWDGSPPAERPSFYQFEGGDEVYEWTTGAIQKRTVPVRWFMYFDATNGPQGATINAVMDALDAGLALTGRDLITGKCSLGGTCDWCRIVGQVLREPGDLDNDGILMVPFQITLP